MHAERSVRPSARCREWQLVRLLATDKDLGCSVPQGARRGRVPHSAGRWSDLRLARCLARLASLALVCSPWADWQSQMLSAGQRPPRAGPPFKLEPRADGAAQLACCRGRASCVDEHAHALGGGVRRHRPERRAEHDSPGLTLGSHCHSPSAERCMVGGGGATVPLLIHYTDPLYYHASCELPLCREANVVISPPSSLATDPSSVVKSRANLAMH